MAQTPPSINSCSLSMQQRLLITFPCQALCSDAGDANTRGAPNAAPQALRQAGKHSPCYEGRAVIEGHNLGH